MASRIVAALPVYQVALWPDGWVLGASGEVSVRDTHAMAEARRWHAQPGRHVGVTGRRGRAADLAIAHPT